MKLVVLLPALIHLYVFVLESLLWGRPRTNRTFGLKPQDVEATRLMAFNQGIYNLLLAAAVLVGFFWVGTIGLVLMIYGLVSIAVAGAALLLSAPRLWRSALIQLVPALAGLAVLVWWP